MSVPTTINDLSETESSNSPAGNSSIGTSLDDFLRAGYAITKQQAIKGDDIASGGTITIPTIGGYFVVTGTTNISAINDAFNGRVAILKFSGILTIADSSALILFGSDITTAAGDVLAFVNESAGVFRLLYHSKATDDGVTLAGAETLTNKTIVAASNTVTTAASGNLVATELNAALAELEAEITANTGNITTNTSDISTLDTDKAPIASPTFTGVPAAPTAAADTDTTQIATTEYTQTELANKAATAWCTFDGTDTGTNAPSDGHNVADVTRVSAGVYDVNFTTAMDNVLYSVSLSSLSRDRLVKMDASSVNSVRVWTYTSSDVAQDISYISVQVYGGLT